MAHFAPTQFLSLRTVSLLCSCLILLAAISCIVDSNQTMSTRGAQLTQGQPVKDPTAINLEPFRELARNESCADVRNRLFLIDRRMVFWTRESNCSDAAYGHTLYGRTVWHIICDVHDSIAGPQGDCDDSGPDVELFDVMIQHLDDEDLGIGDMHRVDPIKF